ncbi:hypothetical protein llap_18336 [Limosa lapponica baueri]|uniref:Uncharacterized protein n=1 Tax=Limosa lapponica baueri TaxID=1758121 RepID=A0A2I0TC33_LIMLA|nr:hypothetical protein llap_18336 [Limosa lapponica baueri]
MRTAVQFLNTQRSTGVMLRPRDLVLVNGHLNLLALAAQAQGKGRKIVETSASGNCEASNGGSSVCKGKAITSLQACDELLVKIDLIKSFGQVKFSG